MTEQLIEKPEFLTNNRGFQVPVKDIPAQDLLKTELVSNSVAKAIELSQQQEDFKRKVFTEVNDFIALVADEYNVKVGGAKGNVTLTSFDGKQQIKIGIDDLISFGPEIDVAKQLITEVIEAELSSSSDLISNLMRDAFEADKQGNYNKNRILALRKYRHANDSEKWQQAMKALDDAIILSNSKTYVTFHIRNKFGKWEQIPLAGKSL